MQSAPSRPRCRQTCAWLACVALCAGWLIAALGAQAQQPAAENIGWVPRDILERPVTLRSGIGVIHQAVSTASPQAQAFYDQGQAYLYSYVWIEAARSFHQALRLDPALAMAYLGLSETYLGLQDLPASQAAFAKAQELAGKVSERERKWIALRARYFEYLAGSSDMQKYFAYRQAIVEGLTAHPDDPQLWILRGFADEGTPISHGQNGGVDTIAFYQAALAYAPDNFAGHHFLAHTFENVGPTEQALAQAAAFARLAPAIPHAHHMVGHDLRRAGRTEEAVAEFRKADELENLYYRSENIPARYDWHHAHNLQLLAMSYETLGQMKTAEAAYREAFAQPMYSDLADYNRKAWPQFLLARGRAQEALDAAQELIRSRWALAQIAGHAMAGHALLALGRADDAQSELALAEQQVQQAPPAISDRFPDAFALRAELLLQEKKFAEGNALMNEFQQKLEALPGPDSWSETLFELEAVAQFARRVNDWELAESAAQRMIAHDPSYAGGYQALGLAAQHEGDATAARQNFARANQLWSKADPDFPRPQPDKP